MVTLIVVVIVAAVALLGWWFLLRKTGKQGPQVITNVVTRAPYEFVVIEQGEVEAANATELKCEVKSRGTGGSGITILEVLPEGTPVKEGDVLVKLDSSALELERVTQQIKVHQPERPGGSRHAKHLEGCRTAPARNISKEPSRTKRI